MMSRPWLQKFVFAPILILSVLAPIFAPFAESFSFPDRYDLVVILVEQGLYADNADYAGLTDSTTIKARVDRYAIDVQNALPGTRAVVIQADRFEETQNIAAVLERLYFDGDPDEPNRTAYLRGVVVVGEVPLPVVNKNFNRFISLYPYTDFKEKAYVYNLQTRDFEFTDEAVKPEPEIWHGVIRPPVSTQTEDGKNLLAAYFDKNHLYHTGDSAYAQFDKKVFFSDFFHEAKNINPAAYKQYMDFLEHQDDIAYLRYTKELYADLAGPAEDAINEAANAGEEIAALEDAGISVSPVGTPEIDLPPDAPSASDIADFQEGGGVKQAVPDIMTKIGKMTDGLMLRFNQIFAKYPNLINDFIKYTGRYAGGSGVDSAVNLITAKDQYAMEFLKSVNTAVEEKIDEIIRNSLEEEIPLVKTASIYVTSLTHDPLSGEDAPFTVNPGGDVSSNLASFTNFSPKWELDTDPPLQARKPGIRGMAFEDIIDASQCSVFRGSEGGGGYSKLVEANHAFNQMSALDADGSFESESDEDADLCSSMETLIQTVTGLEFSGKNCPAFFFSGGCYYEAQGISQGQYDIDNPELNWCFAENAVRPVFDIAGTRQRKSADAPINFDDYRSCFDFHEKEKWEGHLDEVQEYFADIDDYNKDFDDRRTTLRPPDIETSGDKHPDSIILVQSTATGDSYIITMGDLMRAMGFSTGANWRENLNLFFASAVNSNTFNVPVNHPKISSVTFVLAKSVDHYISSVFEHKEPTNETLNAQAKNLISEALPVDSPRYVTFRDKNGAVKRITYPDIFSASSADEYVETLKAIEAELNAAPRGALSAPCSDCLVNAISGMNTAKTLDALNWKNMDTDSKHLYMISVYLDPTKNAYVGETDNGYEIAYFNGEGNALGYEFSLHKSDAEETDSASGLAAGKDKYEDDPNNPFDAAPEDTAGRVGYDLFSWSPPPISPWWEKTQEWADNLTQDTEEHTFGGSQDDFYNGLAEGNAKELEEIVAEQKAIDGNPSSADELAKSRIASIAIEADSTIVAAGGQAEARIILKDKKGEIVRDEFPQVALTIEGGAFAENTDNPLTVIEGEAEVSIVAPEQSGSIVIKADIAELNRSAELALGVIKDGALKFQSAVASVKADGSSEAAIDIFAIDGAARALTQANGKISVSVSDPALGRIREQEVKLTAGRATVHFVVGKRTGRVSLSAIAGGLDSGALTLELLPGSAARIALTAASDTLGAEPGATLSLFATLYDENNNAVTTDSSTNVSFRITDSTAQFAELSAPNARAENGIASVTISPKDITGEVRIIAEGTGLIPANLALKSKKIFGRAEVAALRPASLVASLLGIPAGNVSEKDYFGGWFVMNGKTQAANSLTASARQYKKLFEITENGGIIMAPPVGRVSAQFSPANNLTFILRDNESSADLAQVTVYSLKKGEYEVLETDTSDPSALADGIYMRKLAQGDEYRIDRVKGALRIAKSGEDAFEIQTNGYVRAFADSITVRPVSAKFLTMEILDKDKPVARVYFVQRFNQDVSVQDSILEAPGVYVRPVAPVPNYSWQRAFSGNSTADPRGVVFFDTREIATGADSPGFSFASLEDSLDRFGIGFTQDNKFALLFASGETFGEANRAFASDIGIVLGDPTVRVDNRSEDGFSADIGKLVYSGGSPARGILPFDYNSDGLEDILIVYGDGKIRLIQNYGGYDKLKDQGFILNAKNGIQDFTKVDYNNDGQMDLVIAGVESCRKDDTCLDVYENRNSALVRHNIHFNETDKIVTVKAEDLNRDSYADLILADAAGDIRILYNKNGAFDEETALVGNTGLQIDSAKNLASSLLIRYTGMATKNPEDPQSAQKYQTISLPESNPAATADSLGAGVVDSSVKYVSHDFIYADLDSVFGESTKSAQDLNGGVVRTGDRIKYTIQIKNNSAAVRTGVMVSDLMSEQIEIDTASIACTDCGSTAMGIAPLGKSTSRPLLFSALRVPANGSRTITYEGVFKGSADESDKIKIAVSSKFSDNNTALNDNLKRDNYPDISVTKEGNPTGQVRYYYTTGILPNGNLVWSSGLSSPPVALTQEEFKEKTGLKVPTDEELNDFEMHCFLPDDIEEIIDGADRAALNFDEDGCTGLGGNFGPKAPPPIASEGLSDLQNMDTDGDGLQDSIDDLNGGLDAVAGATQAAVDKLTCDAGCLALPVNAAFLTPGFWSILGTPDGYDVGLPVFGWGAPSLPPTWPPAAPISTTGGRVYVSPTLTGGVGFAVCFGPFGAPRNCYSFGVNPLDLIAPGTCDSLNGAISGAISRANDVIADANEGVTLTLGANGGTIGTGSRESTGSGLTNYSLGSYESPVKKSVNVKIPGFPNVITDWWEAQTNEIEKALDVPDIYLIYPSGDSLVGSFQPTEEFGRTGDVFTNLLSYINSIPLIDIETQEVLFKIPALTRKEIERVKADARQWIEDEKYELDKWRNAFGCVINPDLDTCRFVTVEMNKLIKTVSDNLRALDEWILFPKKILQFRAIEAYYINQIIDYLDTVTKFTGGWVKRNTAIVKRWRRAVRDIKDMIENWRALVQLMIDYNESCDKCKTERYGLKDLLLKLFIGLPSPPVIPLPKLPDIIIDVSKIQAGARIQFPDVKFKPEPLILPKLPRIGLGINLTIPLFKLIIPAIPVIPLPPNLPSLPALPPLNLPRLPDLPPPPTVPALPWPITATISILKKIVKILCIIRLGFTPTDEVILKQRIEEITARGLTPILPIDMLFTVQSPTITVEYVDQIIATVFSNFRLETSYVYDVVKNFADQANNFTTNLAEGINRFTTTLSEQVQQATNPQINIGIPGPEGRQLNYLPDTPKLPKELLDLGREFGANAQALKAEGERRALENSKIPDAITLNVTQERYTPSEARRLYQLSTEQAEQSSSRFSMLKDYDVFDSYFAESGIKKLLAAKNLNSGLAAGSLEPVKVGEIDGAFGRMIAALPGSPPEIELPGLAPGTGGPAQTGQINDIGIFFVDNNGESKRLVNYTLEASSDSLLADIDIDSDGDKDKLYSYGPNVFLKRNERIEDDEDIPVFRSVDVEYWTIAELKPFGTSPNSPKVLNETAKEAVFSSGASIMKDAAGYEVIARESPSHFENPGAHKSWRAQFMKEAADSSAGLPLQLKLVNPDGEITLNNQPVSDLKLKPGDYVGTGEDSSAQVEASDGTIFNLSEETVFAIPEGANMTVVKGELEVIIPESGGYIVKPGAQIIVESGRARVRLFDGSDFMVAAGNPFTMPDFKRVKTIASNVSGSARFTAGKRSVISPQSGRVRASAGEIIHPLEVAEIQMGAARLTLSKDMLLTVPDSFATGVDIEVREGSAEIISAERTTQDLGRNMAVTFGDSIEVRTGEVRLNAAHGGATILRANEIYSLFKAESMLGPVFTLPMSEGFYFAKIYPFDSDGNRGTSSETLLLTLQVCGDTTPPLANLGAKEFTVAVGKTLALDAGRSFDTYSRIESYKLGDVTQDNPKFTLGPYSEVGDRQIMLTVRDAAQNEGYQDITVHVITPTITLDAAALKNNVISGRVTPVENAVPVTIARLQKMAGRGWEIFRTALTNEDGVFKINDIDTRPRLVVRNFEGKIVAEINKNTGRITITDGRYEVKVAPNAEELPTRVGIYEKSAVGANAFPLTFVYFVPDVNVDASIDSENTEYSVAASANLFGVHIRPLEAAADNKISFNILSADHEKTPGAAEILLEGKTAGLIDVNGNMKFDDPNFELGLTAGEFTEYDPVIFELKYRGKAVAEIYIAAHLEQSGSIEIMESAAPVARPTPKPKKVAAFNDISAQDPFARTIQKLFERGIVAGYPSTVAGELLFKPENKINRAEFTQITLRMLCIVPREEAKRLPTPFYDVLDPKLWFYPALKEGNIREFIKGYLGEARGNQTPFKPANNITRAEAVTVVLAALHEQGIIDLNGVDFSADAAAGAAAKPWYAKYIEVAQNIEPYVKDKVVGSRAFIITSDEAIRPDEAISRRDFAIMAERVLLIHDCYAGIEQQIPIAPPAEPEPVLPSALLRKQEGIFILNPSCGNVCPCRATLGPGGDLAAGDIIFAAITGPDGLPIYAKSNEETY